jgi:uncharacterized protein
MFGDRKSGQVFRGNGDLTLPGPRRELRPARRLLGGPLVCNAAKSKKIARACEFIVWTGLFCLTLAVTNSPPSPCTGVCRIDWTFGLCEGCKRTLNEIADWPMLKPAEKRAILAKLPGRP